MEPADGANREQQFQQNDEENENPLLHLTVIISSFCIE